MVATLLKISGDKKHSEDAYLDEDTCRVYSDQEGLHLLRTITQSEDGVILTGTDSVGNPRPKIMRHPSGRPANINDLAMAATAHDAQQRANAMGRTISVKCRDNTGEVVEMSFRSQKPILMDLAVTDVHQPATLPNYAAGYRLCQEGIADIMSPVVPVAKQQDYYGTWNVASDFAPPQVHVASAGGQVAEINPALTFTQYNAVGYALGGALPTEVLANADTPFAPLPKLMQVIVDKLRLARNVRVANLMETSSGYQSSVVQTILSGGQWNEGASSNPLLVLHKAMDASYLPVTGIGVSGQLWRAWIRNANFQKFFTFKDGIDPIPNYKEIPNDFKLPTIYVDETKYTVGGSLSFVWGNDVVLIHEPTTMPPTSQMDVATSTTFRWIGGTAPPDGALTGGMLVRSYFDPKRGPRGSTVVTCAHYDTEVMTSGYAGALVINAYQ